MTKRTTKRQRISSEIQKNHLIAVRIRIKQEKQPIPPKNSIQKKDYIWADIAQMFGSFGRLSVY